MNMNMKKAMVFLQMCALASGCCVCSPCNRADAPKVSVFSGTIDSVAKSRGVTIGEAADMLREVGIGGFDCSYSSPKLAEYAASSLKPINLYGGIDFFAADGGRAQSEAFVAAAVKYGVPRIMCIPPGFTDGKENEAEVAKCVEGLRHLVAIAKKEGVAVTVEDYGGATNPCSWSKYLKRFMTEIPDLRYALDSGNFVYAGRGEDILDMMRFAEGRIEHVHLKDFKQGSNRVRETIGLGPVPNGEIVRTVAASGYDGWYTLEDLVGDRLEDVVRQVAMVRFWSGSAKRD